MSSFIFNQKLAKDRFISKAKRKIPVFLSYLTENIHFAIIIIDLNIIFVHANPKYKEKDTFSPNN